MCFQAYTQIVHRGQSAVGVGDRGVAPNVGDEEDIGLNPSTWFVRVTYSDWIQAIHDPFCRV